MFAHLIQDPPAAARHVENPAPPVVVDAWGQLPKLASTFNTVDDLFYFTYAVCIFFFVLILGVLLFSVVKYRRKTDDQPPASTATHNTPLEVVWTVIPLIIVMVMFAWGFKGNLDMSTMPASASRNMYKATASQWSWKFNYPGSAAESFNELWLEVGKPAGFALESTDVLHAFFIPNMRVKRDIVPGRFQTLWFTPIEIGDYHLFCAEYCGKDHSRMYAQVHVVSAEEYAKKPWDVWLDSTPAEAAKSGERLYKAVCSSCHTTDGTASVGPSWKGLFVKGADGTITGGQREVFVGTTKQTITVDKAYIMESLQKPEAKKAAGFERNLMTAFELPERKIDGLIEFMKTLAEK